MGIQNNHAVDNENIEFYYSEYPFESKSDYFPDLDNTPIKSIDDDEIDQLIELFH